MAKRFSIVSIGEENEVFLCGYKGFKDLSESNTIVKILSEISSFVKVRVEINHCLLLDFPEPIEDINNEELEILLESFDDLVDRGHIYSEEIAETEVYGLMEDEIVEEKAE